MIDLLNYLEFSVANANCQPAIPIAARQTPVVRLQSRLQRGKRQLSGCNPDCSAANASCQAAIPIAAQQTPIVRLQSRLHAANANCQAAATTGNRRPQSPCSAPKFVRRHIAIVSPSTI